MTVTFTNKNRLKFLTNICLVWETNCLLYLNLHRLNIGDRVDTGTSSMIQT